MHFYRSLSTSARRPNGTTLAALSQTLDDTFHVWANVDFTRYEFDWLVWGSQRGWFGVYEEKLFFSVVQKAQSEGRPWVLSDGTNIDNPYEQVSRAAEAFRGFVRNELIPRFFSKAEPREVKVYRGVFCPNITSATSVSNPRFGRLFANEHNLAEGIRSCMPHYPLRLDDAVAASDVVAFLNDALAAVPDRVPTEPAAPPADSPTVSNTLTTEAPGQASDALLRGLMARIDQLERQVAANADNADEQVASGDSNGQTAAPSAGVRKNKGSGRFRDLARRARRQLPHSTQSDPEAVERQIKHVLEWLQRDPSSSRQLRDEGLPLSIVYQLCRDLLPNASVSSMAVIELALRDGFVSGHFREARDLRFALRTRMPDGFVQRAERR